MIEAKAVQAGWSPAGKSAGKSVRISHRELRQLTRKSGLRSALVIAAQWLIISAAMAVAIWLDAWYGYLLAIVVIASRQHALGVLMHDAAHFLLFKNRLLNDVVSELFLAFPLFVSTSLYRHHHFLHHGHLNTDQDPDLDSESAQRSRVEWLRLFTGDLLGLSLLKTADTVTQWSMLGLLGKKRSERPPLQPWQLPLFLFFLAALATVLTLTGGGSPTWSCGLSRW